jgi:hypothetical protein
MTLCRAKTELDPKDLWRQPHPFFLRAVSGADPGPPSSKILAPSSWTDY